LLSAASEIVATMNNAMPNIVANHISAKWKMKYPARLASVRMVDALRVFRTGWRSATGAGLPYPALLGKTWPVFHRHSAAPPMVISKRRHDAPNGEGNSIQ
jgi:hypothetical protein